MQNKNRHLQGSIKSKSLQNTFYNNKNLTKNAIILFDHCQQKTQNQFYYSKTKPINHIAKESQQPLDFKRNKQSLIPQQKACNYNFNNTWTSNLKLNLGGSKQSLNQTKYNQEQQVLNTFKMKTNITNLTKRNEQNKINLQKFKQNALKSLLNKKHFVFSPIQFLQNPNTMETKQCLLKLIQKDIMIDKILQVLIKNNIDLKQLLQTSLENLQCENYLPPSSDRIPLDDYYHFQDNIKINQTNKQLSNNLKQQLIIDMNQVQQEESSSKTSNKELSISLQNEEQINAL